MGSSPAVALILAAKLKPRRIPKVSRKLRFPAKQWQARYVKAVRPELAERASSIVTAAWDAGVIAELWKRQGHVTSKTATEEDDDWLKRELKRWAARYALNIEPELTKLTGGLFQASSSHAFSKIGIDAVWKLKSPAVEAAIKQRVNLITEVSDTSFDLIRSAIRQEVYANGGSPVNPKLLADIQKHAGRNAQYQAELIARTESAAVIGQGSFTVYERNGVERKGWLWSGISREEHAAMDGEEVEIGDSFSNGLMFPGDPAGDISETANCGCDFYPIIASAIDPDEVETE